MMKTPSEIRRIFLISVLLFACGEIPVFGQAHKPIVPLPPSELLPLLPATPKGWELKQSVAKNMFVEWLCSNAMREFQGAPTTTSIPGATPSPPQIARIKILDTGYFPSFNGDFENFQVGNYGTNESLMINGMRARRIIIGPDHIRLKVSVRGRFIVEIEVQHQPPKSELSWLGLIDLRKLGALPDSGSEKLPKPIIISTVDELNPKKNATSELHWGE
jgi:hypothetical protein